MNPVRLSAENYRSWQELDLTLPDGCTAIVGSNGAGKSSIVNLVDVCLFGHRHMGDMLADGEERMTVTLEFEHDRLMWRIRRSYSGRGRGQTKLDLEKRDGEGWLPASGETAAETQAIIDRMLGLSRETFRASAFLAQGDSGAFTEAQPADRKRILAEVLALDVWDRLLERCRREKTAVEAEVGRLRARIEVAEHDLVGRKDLVAERDAHAVALEETAAKLAAGEAERGLLAERVAAAREAHATLAASVARLSTLATQLTQLQYRCGQLAEEDKRIREQQANLASLEPLAARHDDLTRELEAAGKQAERQRLAGEHAKLAHQIEILENEPEATCPTCGQHVDRAAKAHAVAAIADQANAIRWQLEQLPTLDVAARGEQVITAELDAARLAREQIAAINAAAERQPTILAELDQARQNLHQAEQEHAAVQAEHERLKTHTPDPVRVAQELADLDSQISWLRQQHADADKAVARCDTQLERLATLEREAQAAQDTLTSHQRELDLLLTLETAYNRNGIPALIVENAAAPHIQLEANRILADLNTDLRVELQTQRTLKTSGETRDTLDIIVTGANTTARPYETFSGGERSRLNIALRIALARLLAHRRGADSRILILDEIEYLDDPGQEQLAQVLRTLTGDFDKIILVSHTPGLRDAFDQTFTVSRDSGPSTLAEGAGLPMDTVEVAA